MSVIPFNRPYSSDLELAYVRDCILSAKLSGDGPFTKQCQAFFENRYAFQKTLLTTSCTDALEMCALLLRVGPGDEIILPSFTFVSSANAFALRGATLVFADSSPDNPNISPAEIEALITPRTKAIVVVHYAGVACDMDRILNLARPLGIAVVEDAAQAVDSFYKGRPLGGLGALAAFSFHETKNISSGEGGLLVVNDDRHAGRAEIIREKGTNRSSFFRGEVDKYGWVDVGSSFLPSELTAAYLLAQLERIEIIQAKRKYIWGRYWDHFSDRLPAKGVGLPTIPSWATNNAHMFYLVAQNLDQRSRILSDLREQGIHSTFHYLSLHDSPYFQDRHDGRQLPHSDRFTNCLFRLPLYFEMSDEDVDRVAEAVVSGFSFEV